MALPIIFVCLLFTHNVALVANRITEMQEQSKGDLLNFIDYTNEKSWVQ